MGVRMEYFRMFMYLAFPTTLFYIANRPAIFEDRVTSKFNRDNLVLKSVPPEEIERQVEKLKKYKETQREK